MRPTLTLPPDQWTRLEVLAPTEQKPAPLVKIHDVDFLTDPLRSTAPADLICRGLIERSRLYQTILHEGLEGLVHFIPPWIRTFLKIALWPMTPRTHVVYVKDAPTTAPTARPRPGKGPLRLPAPAQKRLSRR